MGQLVLLEEAGGGIVGRQHAFLDQFVRVIADHGDDLLDLLVLAENNAGFLGFKIDGGPIFTSPTQGPVEGVKFLEVRNQFPVLAAGHLVSGQNGRDLGIGQTGMRVHQTLEKPGFLQVAVTVDEHFADHAQPVRARVQRAQAVRQHLRQHRYDPVGKVHRGTALLGLRVQRRFRLHVGGHICYCHIEFPTLGRGFAVDRVVEIARVLAVDGDQWQLADILAPRPSLIRDLLAPAGDLLLHGLGPLARQIVAVNGYVDLHARGQMLTQHLNDATDGIPLPTGLLDDFHDHNLPGNRIGQRFGGNQEVVGDVFAVGNHEVDAALLVQTPDNAVSLPLKNLHDTALATAAAVHAAHADQHPVVMHQRPHFLGGQVQILAALVRPHEAEAIRVGNDSAGDQIFLIDDAVAVAAIAQQLTVALHGIEPAAQGLAVFVIGNFQQLGDFLTVERHPLFVEYVDDEFTAGNGAGVFAGLSLRVGVPEFVLAGGFGSQVCVSNG